MKFESAGMAEQQDPGGKTKPTRHKTNALLRSDGIGCDNRGILS